MVASAAGALLDQPSELALGLVLVALLAVVALTDFKRRVIPNPVLMAGAAVGMALVVATDAGSLVERGIAATSAAGVLLAASLAYPGGMGMGDVKLTAVMGLYLGRDLVPGLLVAIVAGAIVGLALLLRDGSPAGRTIPFGPFLALGGVAGLLAGGELIDWYLASTLESQCSGQCFTK